MIAHQVKLVVQFLLWVLRHVQGNCISSQAMSKLLYCANGANKFVFGGKYRKGPYKFTNQKRSIQVLSLSLSLSSLFSQSLSLSLSPSLNPLVWAAVNTVEASPSHREGLLETSALAD